MGNLVEDLQKIRDQIAKGWCVGAYARDNQRNAVPFTSPEATSWCLVGAVMLHGLYDNGTSTPNFIRSKLPDRDLSVWNDKQPNQETVLAELDEIIEEAKRL